MRKVIFSKYSNDRAKSFAIRTDILSENGKKIVKKSAMSEDGIPHIKAQSRYFADNEKAYQQNGFELIRCIDEGDSVLYDFIDGETISEIIDRYIFENKIAEAQALITQFGSQVRKMFSVHEWKPSERFSEIFGDASFTGRLASDKCNIDLVMENVIVYKDKSYVMDYEWTFDFDIPADYVVYRSIRTLMYSGGSRKCLQEEKLYDMMQISEEDCRQYKAMEERFQQYVLNGRTTASYLYGDIGKPSYAYKEYIKYIESRRQRQQAVVYFDYGTGYSEDNKYTFTKPQDSYLINIPEAVRTVRFDACSYPCILKNIRINNLDINECRDYKISNNGRWSREGLVFFTDDPQIIIEGVKGSILEIAYDIEPLKNAQMVIDELDDRIGMQEAEINRLSEELGGCNAELAKCNLELEKSNSELAKRNLELEDRSKELESCNKELIRYNKELTELEGTNAMLNSRIDELNENITAANNSLKAQWELHCLDMKALSEEKGDNVYYHIDRVICTEEETAIEGWLFSKRNTVDKVMLCTFAGEYEINCKIERGDVRSRYKLCKNSLFSGFSCKIKGYQESAYVILKFYAENKLIKVLVVNTQE